MASLSARRRTSLNRLFPKPLQKPPTRRKQEKGDDKIADTVQHVEGNPCHPGDGEHPEPSHRQIDQRTQRPKGQAKAAGQDLSLIHIYAYIVASASEEARRGTALRLAAAMLCESSGDRPCGCLLYTSRCV